MNNRRIIKRFESQYDPQLKDDAIQSYLADMDDTARGIIRYGMEAAEIADLMEEAESRLDADYWKADEDGDEETKKAIEDEMERIENEATECCRKIIDAIDSVLPYSKLTHAQKERLKREFENLKAYDTWATEDPVTFIKLIVAEYALSEDNGLLDEFEFAIQNALDEEDEEMDESVHRCISKSRKLESDYDDEYDDEEFEVMSVDDIANWLSDLYETDVEANWDGDVLTLNVKTDNKKELSIEIFHDQSFSDMSIWYANYRTPKYEYSKELRLNDDDERAYAAELAMKFAKSKDWFNDDFKDDEEFESVRRRRNLRRVIESRCARSKN